MSAIMKDHEKLRRRLRSRLMIFVPKVLILVEFAAKSIRLLGGPFVRKVFDGTIETTEPESIKNFRLEFLS